MLKMSDSGIDRIAIMIHPENGIPGCYAVDNSLLVYTQHGWKQAESVTLKDKVLQYKEGRTTFAGIEDVITADYKGELLALRTPTGNITWVTPNHRFVVVEGNTTREIFASDMKSFVNYRFPGVFFYAINDGNAVIPSESKVIYKNVAFSSITVEKFNGKLFCLETQTGNFLVRHKDLIYFSGNSAGCIVIIWETKEQKEVLRKLFAKFNELAKQKIQHLKLTVFN
jgi:outer membrane protein assembly factor BamB